MADSGNSDPAEVTLRPMSVAQFEVWKGDSVLSFAESLSQATGRSLVQTRERSQQIIDELLPDGIDTATTWLRVVVDASIGDVGVIWVGPQSDRPTVVVVYDIEIAPQWRGRGFGRAAMLAAESMVAAAGMTEIGLNVFGFNETARHLYDSLGYRVVATQMTKTL